MSSPADIERHFAVDAQALVAAGTAIQRAQAELVAIGMDSDGGAAHLVSELSLGELAVGSHQVHAAFDEFCQRWSWGIRGLVHDGADIAGRLGATAENYSSGEKYARDTLTDVWHKITTVPDLAVGGDGHG